MKKSPFFLAALITAAAPLSLSAATVYWDSNDINPGAGDTPNGTWASSPFWSTDPLGEAIPVVWTAGDTAVFSAGTDAVNAYTVTGSGTSGAPGVLAAGVIIEDGLVTFSGGTLGLGAGFVTIKAGAALSTDSSLRISSSAGSVWPLDGGTAISTNPVNAGSFIDVDSTITLAAGGGTISHTVPNILNIVQTTTIISGPGSLTKTGPGVIAIASPCTYLGSTSIIEGELRIRASVNRLPITTALTVDSPGILNLNNVSQQIGSLSGGGLVGLGNATLTVGDATNTIFTGSIRDTANAGAGGTLSLGGRVTKVGTGSLTLSGANNYSGTTTIIGGTLKAGHAAAMGFGGIQFTTTATTVVASGATLDLNGTSAVNEPITLNGTGVGGNGALVNNSGTPASVGNGIAGIQLPTVTGSGSGYSTAPTITISGNGSGATATAALGVTAASFAINGGTTIYSTAPTVAIGGGGFGATATAILTGGVVSGITITNAGTRFSVAPTITFSGGTVATAGVNPTGTGNDTEFTVNGLTMTDAGSGYTGTTFYTFDSGNANPGTLTRSSVVLASNSSIGGSGDMTISAVVSESTSGKALTKVGAGTVTLAGANSYTGATTVSGGTLKLGNAAALGFGGAQTNTTGTTTVGSGFTLDLNGSATVNEPIILNGTGLLAKGALVNNSGTAATIGSGMAGLQVASVTGTGSGYSSAPTVTISGTGSGATAVATLGVTAASFTLNFGDKVYTVAPTVTIGGGSGSGATAVAVLSGGTTGTLIGITITNAGTGYVTAPTIAFGAGTFSSGTVSGSGTGNATQFTVSGASVTAPGSGYTGTPTYTFGSGSATPGTVTLSSVALAADSSIGGTGDITIASALVESGGARTLTKVGSGTLTISGPQSYSSLLVNEGRTNLNSPLSNATITDAAGALLNVNANANGSTVNVNGSTAFTVNQTLAALNIGATGVVSVGLPALADGPDTMAATDGLIEVAGNAALAVPEPGSLGLLAFGALGLIGRRRSAK